MGLDSVELVVLVEQAFNISIPDIEASRISTVGDFHNVVWEKIKSNQQSACHTAPLFYKLRSHFVEIFHIDRTSFIPQADINNLISHRNRRKLWRQLQEESSLQLPKFVLSSKHRLILNSIGALLIISCLITSIIFCFSYRYSKFWLLLPFVGISLTSLLSKIFDSLRVIVKEVSVRAFIEKTLALNITTLSKNGINRAEMELVMNQLISDISGLEISEIYPSQRIHQDLGID
ncbi:hypothetical protein [Mucilaginibacter sp. KACC 22063]|uniref:hypothetical protein n=1 Tax=Mucilaginibacter sp. KACC 22063 TaxID=3025666 RepID=UPI002366FA9A|nr:hypothetical protein [Mucilaginibacter sp. KACC 22063]WDF54770.1 hypothetical protein PQ461_17710 [Mucilaginibacter sp. KACC 22063]